MVLAREGVRGAVRVALHRAAAAERDGRPCWTGGSRSSRAAARGSRSPPRRCSAAADEKAAPPTTSSSASRSAARSPAAAGGDRRTERRADSADELRRHPRRAAEHHRGAADQQRGAEGLQRGGHEHQRGAAEHQRGAGDEQGGDAVAQRGADDRQRPAPGEDGGAPGDQQRPGEPADQHRHRRAVPRHRVPHPPVHPGRPRPARPDRRATSAGRWRPWPASSTTRTWTTTPRRCWSGWCRSSGRSPPTAAGGTCAGSLPYRTADNRIDGVVITFVDITARRQAEEALRASEEQFRRAIEDAPIPVIMQAEDGQVLQVSRTWTELTGLHAGGRADRRGLADPGVRRRGRPGPRAHARAVQWRSQDARR